MFPFRDSKSPASKAYLSSGNLPHYVDPEQPPSKKKPFSTILAQPFTHSVQLILPQELYGVVWKDVEAKISNFQYSRVIMSLSEVLQGSFFNEYIKIGNILMLSEGRPGVDDRYSLKDGILRLELAKDKYERCGLVGQPIRDAGRRHMKTRFAVEINLRSPAMLHGKKAFERIVWAFKNVLNHSVTWLFHDFTSHSGHAESLPIAKHHPVTKDCLPQLTTTEGLRVPNLSPIPTSDCDDDFEDWALETYEWLSLVALRSPRIVINDAIDPFLSRYQIPDADSGKDSQMVALTWTGLIPASWIMQLFIYLSSAKTTRQEGAANESFFALNAYSFKTTVADQKDAYTLLCLSQGTVDDRAAVSASAANKVKEPRKSEGKQRHGKRYHLWELTCG